MIFSVMDDLFSPRFFNKNLGEENTEKSYLKKQSGPSKTIPSHISIDGNDIAFEIKPNRRAKYMRLRYNSRERRIMLTTPWRFSKKKAMEFVSEHHDWLKKQIEKQGDIILLNCNEYIPFKGIESTLIHDANAPSSPYFNPNTRQIICGGDARFFSSRIESFLKKTAKDCLSHHAYHYAEKIEKNIHKLTVRDTVSRWGSCNGRGHISLNWRLIMAPPLVAEYVVVHEVSHLIHMNHSEKFWRQVAQLMPDYEIHKKWLYENGESLHLIHKNHP